MNFMTEISPKKSASGGGFTPTSACRMAVAASGQTPGTQGISPVFCWENARSIAGKIFLVDFLLPLKTKNWLFAYFFVFVKDDVWRKLRKTMGTYS